MSEKKCETVPCSIEEGKVCAMPFCDYIYFTQRAKKAFDRWIRICKEEVDSYKRLKAI